MSVRIVSVMSIIHCDHNLSLVTGTKLVGHWSRVDIGDDYVNLTVAHTIDIKFIATHTCIVYVLAAIFKSFIYLWFNPRGNSSNCVQLVSTNYFHLIIESNLDMWNGTLRLQVTRYNFGLFPARGFHFLTLEWHFFVLPCLKMSAHLNNSFIFITNFKFTKSFNSYLCLKLQQESTQAACRQASRVEEVARERCRQMFEDLNSHCRIPVSSCCTLKLLNHLVALDLTGQAH